MNTGFAVCQESEEFEDLNNYSEQKRCAEMLLDATISDPAFMELQRRVSQLSSRDNIHRDYVHTVG